MRVVRHAHPFLTVIPIPKHRGVNNQLLERTNALVFSAQRSSDVSD